MATTIQIIVAGTLLLAWIWVLGRPLMSSRTPSAYEEFLARHPERAGRTAPQPAAGTAGAESSATPAIPSQAAPGWINLARRWWYRPAHVWRRQLLLATMLATFVSFFLAVALRNSLGNTFLYLFAMMVFGLVLHLGIAAYVGGRMLQANRAVAVRTVQAQVRPGGMAIRAEQVGGGAAGSRRPILQDDGDVSLFEFDAADELEADSAFNLAADIASALEHDERAGVIDEVAEVNELIESEWGGEPETPPAPVAGDAEAPPTPDPASATDPTADETEADPAFDPDGEPIFRRAAKDEPPRPKRKPKPIYIESQLDDEPGGGPKAVNYP